MSTKAAQAVSYHNHLHVELTLFWAPDLPNMATQYRQDRKQWLSLPMMTISIKCRTVGVLLRKVPRFLQSVKDSSVLNVSDTFSASAGCSKLIRWMKFH